MPTICFLASYPTPEDADQPGPGAIQKIPLDYRFADGRTYREVWGHRLSQSFWASGRDYALVIRLPDGSAWPADYRFHGEVEPGWVITGEAPMLTASPSVDAKGCYHGWLANGVLSDDLEGRRYD